MFEKLEIFRTAHAMASHAGARQAVLSQNIANADTPGYRARDLDPFQSQFQPAAARFNPRATRGAHLNGVETAYQPRIDTDDQAVASPNGNSVSLEEEMVKAADVKRQHDQAIAIYRASLGILRSSLGRR